MRKSSNEKLPVVGVRPDIKWRLVGILGKALIGGIFATCRIRQSGWEDARQTLAGDNYILALWHSRMLLFSHVFKGLGAGIMVSQSEDGEIIAQILKRQGQVLMRGSSTRGGREAMARLINFVQKKKRPAVMFPDGPVGPRRKAHHGVISLAAKTGLPIVPFTYSAKAAKIFNSWDRFMLPRPFTTCHIVYGKPVQVPQGVKGEAFKALRQNLEDELNRITRLADGRFGREEV